MCPFITVLSTTARHNVRRIARPSVTQCLVSPADQYVCVVESVVAELRYGAECDCYNDFEAAFREYSGKKCS